MAIGTLSVVSWAEQAHTLAIARTMGVVVFPLFNLFFSIESRDRRESVFSLSTFADRTCIVTTGASLFLLVMATVLAPCQAILKTTALDVDQGSSAQPWHCRSSRSPRSGRRSCERPSVRSGYDDHLDADYVIGSSRKPDGYLADSRRRFRSASESDQAMDWPKLLPGPDAEGSPGFIVEVGSAGAGAGQASIKRLSRLADVRLHGALS